eukprot:TRINITY_DN2011_c0_g4_i1.p1 TRINITY_DN2011_c0_g4~~TRINITY_DN2011_c0_g4_i1.p1  ORF type:complete len:446 (-),score=147.50 TRINITY_DN2011_c0_g4_i1:1017-2354(-)
MRKYKKLLRYLFAKYSNTGYSNKPLEFSSLKERAETISIGELTKMVKEHNVVSLNKDEISAIMRLVNAKQGRNDVVTLNFKGFKEFFMQAAIYIYSKEPNALSHLPLLESVRKLVECFHGAAKRRGENTLLYEEPDTTTFGDQDLLKELNKVIKKSPDYPLPEGYHKVAEKEPLFEHKLKPSLNFCITEPYRIAAEILDEIVFAALNTHILESAVKYKQVHKVVPDIWRPQKDLLPTTYMDAVEKKIKTPNNIVKTPIRKREGTPKKITGSMKLAIAKLPKEMKDIGVEVASKVVEILDAVEAGRYFTINKKEVKNRAMKLREEYEQEAREASKEKELKRRLRHQVLKEQVEEQHKKDREMQLEAWRREREIKQRYKALVVRERMERDAAKREFLEFKNKREEEFRKAQGEEERRRKEEMAKRVKDSEQFFRHKKHEMVGLVNSR